MMTNFFPFQALGFQCNPFRALTDEEWVAVAVVPEQLQQVMDGGFDNLQILGEQGYGKTTALRWITAEKRYANFNAAYEYIPEGQETYQTSLEGLDYFLLDEAQRLTKGERGRLLGQSQAANLVVAAHENLAPLFGAYGRPLTTIQLGQTTPDHLSAILDKRLHYFALAGVEPPGFSAAAVDYLWEKFGRDFRAVEMYLYEYFQARVKDVDG